MSLLWSVVKHAVQSPRKIAVVDDRRTYSYAQLVGGALFLAEAVETRTQAPHVGIMLPTSGAFPMALLGVWLAKRVAVPLNYLLAPEELASVRSMLAAQAAPLPGAMRQNQRGEPPER